MILTEEEACTKWCPHVRYKSLRGEGINRWSEDHEKQPNPQLSRCIASECMMWKWTTGKIEPFKEGVGQGPVPSTTHGYCGLTSK